MRVIVTATKDEEADTWVATSDDVPGLVTGAPTLADLVEKLEHLVPECFRQAGQTEQDYEVEIVLSPGSI